MKKQKLAIAICALLPLSAIAAEMHKCPNAAGRIEYRDRPCDGPGGGKVDIRENTSGEHGSLENVRAKAEAIKAREQAQQQAAAQAAAERAAVRQKKESEDRAHEDAVETQRLLKEGGGTPGVYPYGYGYGVNPYYRPDPPKVDVKVIVVNPKAEPKKK